MRLKSCISWEIERCIDTISTAFFCEDIKKKKSNSKTSVPKPYFQKIVTTNELSCQLARVAFQQLQYEALVSNIYIYMIVIIIANRTYQALWRNGRFIATLKKQMQDSGCAAHLLLLFPFPAGRAGASCAWIWRWGRKRC